jgi:hypothetical protein
MLEFRPQHIFHQIEGDGSQIHVGLNQCIVNGLTCIGFQKLTLKLLTADRHEEFLSNHWIRCRA